MKTLPKILKSIGSEAINKLEASSNYTYLTYSDGTKVLSSYSLKVFADLFNTDAFIRVNRSVLVNKSFVKKHVKTNGKDYLQLKNDLKVSIPRRKAERLRLKHPALFR